MYCPRRLAATAVIWTILVPACSRGTPNPEGAAATTESGVTTTQEEKLVPSGLPTIEVVRVVERPVNVTLEMPGELEPYETVAMFPKVTGFVKTIRVDRGSRVRAGELMAELEAPSLLAPSASIASTTGRTFVVRIRNGHTEWVDVKTGLAVGSLVEVFGGLRTGDQIAARGTDEIRPGTQVRVKEAHPPAS